jgi:hypothetical protein
MPARMDGRARDVVPPRLLAIAVGLKQGPSGVHPSRRSASKASSSSSVVPRAVPVEVAQLASEATFIGGTALTMFAITLVVRGPASRPPHAAGGPLLHQLRPRRRGRSLNRTISPDGIAALTAPSRPAGELTAHWIAPLPPPSYRCRVWPWASCCFASSPCSRRTSSKPANLDRGARTGAAVAPNNFLFWFLGRGSGVGL